MTELQPGAVLAATIALVADWVRRRIPNWLTFGAFGVGIVGNLWLGGLAGVALALAGGALGLALFLPFYAIQKMGAGDVKLMAALGAMLGPLPLLTIAVYGGIAGGLLSLVMMARHGVLGAALLQLRSGSLPRTGLRAPYAIAIAIGVYAAAVLPPVLG